MRNKLIWFYQDMEDTEAQPAFDPNKPSTSRQIQPGTSRANVQTAPVYKKKLFLTDGNKEALTGICMYIFRTNTSKQLPEEGFQKVTYNMSQFIFPEIAYTPQNQLESVVNRLKLFIYIVLFR